MVQVRPPQFQSAERGPAVDIRVAAFSVIGKELRVAETLADGEWRLPRAFPAVAGSLDTHARALLEDDLGIPARYLEQLYTLSVETARGWTVVVSYLALVDNMGTRQSNATVRWTTIGSASTDETDAMVLQYAITRLRAKVGYTTVALKLIPEPFTLRDVQVVYEAILGHPLDKRNFRRRLTAANVLQPSGGQRREGSHRPALLYTARNRDDQEAYLTPTWSDARPAGESG